MTKSNFFTERLKFTDKSLGRSSVKPSGYNLM